MPIDSSLEPKRLKPGCLLWDLVAATSSVGDGTTEHFFTIEIAEGRIGQEATLNIIGSESADDVQIEVGESDLDRLAIDVDTRGGNDDVDIDFDLPADSAGAPLTKGRFSIDVMAAEPADVSMA